MKERERSAQAGPRVRLLLESWLLPWLVFAALAGSALRQTSATYDEPVYIVAGVSYLTTGRFVMKDDAPPLVSYLAGAAAMAAGIRLPKDELPFDDSLGVEYSFAAYVLFHDAARGDRALDLARAAVLLPFSLLLFAAVWGWSRDLAGPGAARLAAWLAAGSPSLLAHAGVVSTWSALPG